MAFSSLHPVSPHIPWCATRFHDKLGVSALYIFPLFPPYDFLTVAWLAINLSVSAVDLLADELLLLFVLCNRCSPWCFAILSSFLLWGLGGRRDSFSRLTRKSLDVNRNGRSHCIRSFVGVFLGRWSGKVCWCLYWMVGPSCTKCWVVLWFYLQVLSLWGGKVHLIPCELCTWLEERWWFIPSFQSSRPGFAMDEYRQIRCLPVSSWQKQARVYAKDARGNERKRMTNGPLWYWVPRWRLLGPLGFYLSNYLNFKGSHDESMPENNARVKIWEQLLLVPEWTKESKTWNGECEPAAGGIRPTNRLGAATAMIRGVWIAINPEKCETRATEAYTVMGKKSLF